MRDRTITLIVSVTLARAKLLGDCFADFYRDEMIYKNPHQILTKNLCFNMYGRSNLYLSVHGMRADRILVDSCLDLNTDIELQNMLYPISHNVYEYNLSTLNIKAFK
jgi:hypothetical protein